MDQDAERAARCFVCMHIGALWRGLAGWAALGGDADTYSLASWVGGSSLGSLLGTTCAWPGYTSQWKSWKSAKPCRATPGLARTPCLSEI